MNNFQKLKVGIIVDEGNQNYFTNDLYEKSLDSKYYSIEALIIQKKNKIEKKQNNRLLDQFFFKIITKIETYLVKKKKFF